MDKFYIKNDKLTPLLEKFNNREREAFGEIYTILYKELYYFSKSLYKDSVVDPEDCIQNVFLDIWEDKNREFNTISGLRAFIYVVLKNNFIKYYKHRQVIDKSKKVMILEKSMTYAIEAEVYSIVPEVLDMLPSECASSFKLFLEGWDVKDIADKLGKQPSTIYNQRKDAISKLREKFTKFK